MFVTNDTQWFDENPDKWLSLEEFEQFQALARVELRALISDDAERVRRAQQCIVEQSKIYNEVQLCHAGFMMPLMFYTHDTHLARHLSKWNPELDRFIFASDLGDSLRRRHIALSHAILPALLEEAHRYFCAPLAITNLGSGIGLDIARATLQSNGKVGKVLNYELDPAAVSIGRHVVAWLESRGDLEDGSIEFRPESLTKATYRAHVVVLVGVICGLTDSAAKKMVLRPLYENLEPGGRLLITCANENMQNRDPLHSFLIQHIGDVNDPLKGWGLNFRSEQALRSLLEAVGFRDIVIYHDGEYAGRDALGAQVLDGVDPLPSMALGHPVPGGPINLPAQNVWQERAGYNWIALARK